MGASSVFWLHPSRGTAVKEKRLLKPVHKKRKMGVWQTDSFPSLW